MDVIRGIEVLGSRQFQDGTLTGDALLTELNTQQDIVAEWRAKGVRIYQDRRKI